MCPEDLDGDGSVGVLDLIAVIAGWAFDDLPDISGLRKVRIGRHGFRRRWRAVTNERCSPEHAAALVRSIRDVGKALGEHSWRSRMQEQVS